jgi:GH15 family glucan-1,4-alpha-glucosidase
VAERGYRPIADYAAIGDCHGAALVASDGGVDWCCLGRFDAPPVFSRLLDARRGGHLSVLPRGEYRSSRAYLDGSNVLRTEFRTATGCMALTDFMPVGRKPRAGPYDYVSLNAPGWLVRRVEALEGRVELECTANFSAACEVHGDVPLHKRAVLRAGERRFIAVGRGARRAMGNEPNAWPWLWFGPWNP